MAYEHLAYSAYDSNLNELGDKYWFISCKIMDLICKLEDE
jgi:hypothetical protein